MAFALHMRGVLASPTGLGAPMHAWIDSSPQGGHDWLVMCAHFLPRGPEKRAELAQAVDELCQPRPLPMAAGADDADDSESEPDNDRAAKLTQTLARLCSKHQFTPGALGARVGDVPHKVACLSSRCGSSRRPMQS